jgi:hypothetical protein
VRVELYGHREEVIDAKLLALHDSAHDLAVLTFPTPDGFRWNRKSLGNDDQQKAMTDVTFVGRSQEWYVPTSTVKISGEVPVDERIDIDDLAVRPGSSGGPLIASSGIIGMILRDSTEGAQALTTGMIQLDFKKWGFPFLLESSAPAAEAVTEKSTPLPAEPMSKGEAIAARHPLSKAAGATAGRGRAARIRCRDGRCRKSDGVGAGKAGETRCSFGGRTGGVPGGGLLLGRLQRERLSREHGSGDRGSGSGRGQGSNARTGRRLLARLRHRHRDLRRSETARKEIPRSDQALGAFATGSTHAPPSEASTPRWSCTCPGNIDVRRTPSDPTSGLSRRRSRVRAPPAPPI